MTSEERLRFDKSVLSNHFSKQNSPQLYKKVLLKKREQFVLHRYLGQEIADLHRKVLPTQQWEEMALTLP